MFIILLTSTVNASDHIKCVSLNNQKFGIQPTLINTSNDINLKTSNTFQWIQSRTTLLSKQN